jgi:hypothetical protein
MEAQSLNRSVRVLAFSLVLAGAGCGAHQDTELVGKSQSAVLGSDTFLYLLCNATSWDTNDRSLLVETAPGSGLFNLSYSIADDWLVNGADNCSVVETNQRDGWGSTQTRYAFGNGESSLVTVPDSRHLTPAQSSSFQVKYPAKGQFTVNVNWPSRMLSIGAAVATATVQPQRSLLERNEAALTQFSVAETLSRIATNGGVSGGTPWHDAMFKTQARASDFPGEPGPFCDSAGFPGRVNDFIVGCQGIAAPLVGHLDAWEGLSVANRFDLAPEGGEDCGEARASFYVPPGTLTAPGSPLRSFLIFEAVVPNPHPELGLDGCRPVQAFWSSLSNIADPAARGAKLAQAYYTGEPNLVAAGFKPFFTFENFGPGKGRVRSEAFGGRAVWDLREYRLLAGGGALEMPVAQSVTTQIVSTDAVFGEHPKAAQCRTDLLSGLGTLMPPDFNALGVDVSPACFDGASSNFGVRLEDGITSPDRADFATSLAARAAQLSPAANLTAVQVAARAQFSGTCIGCHFTVNTPAARDLGQGLMLPVPTVQPGEDANNVAFTQVNNLQHEPCAASGDDAAQLCFKLSPVLGGIFLPHRKVVLESYLNTPVGAFHPPAPGTASVHTIGGTPNARRQ